MKDNFRNMWFSPSDIKRISKPTMTIRMVPFYSIECHVRVSYEGEVSRCDSTFSSSSSLSNHFVFPVVEFTQAHVLHGTSSKKLHDLLLPLFPKSFPIEENMQHSLIEPDEAIPWFSACKQYDFLGKVDSKARTTIETRKPDNTVCTVIRFTSNVQNIAHTLCYFPFYISSYAFQGQIYNFAISAEVSNSQLGI